MPASHVGAAAKAGKCRVLCDALLSATCLHHSKPSNGQMSNVQGSLSCCLCEGSKEQRSLHATSSAFVASTNSKAIQSPQALLSPNECYSNDGFPRRGLFPMVVAVVGLLPFGSNAALCCAVLIAAVLPSCPPMKFPCFVFFPCRLPLHAAAVFPSPLVNEHRSTVYQYAVPVLQET